MNPWPKNIALKILCAVWSFPVLFLTFLFVVLPLLVFRQVNFLGWSDGAWDLVIRAGSWTFRHTAADESKGKPSWRGFSCGWFVFYRGTEHAKDIQVRTHERRHMRQQLILGLLQWFSYAVIACTIWLSCHSLHSYSSNPFEIDARLAAGQPVGDLGPKKGDRWPWF
jgi:hypothetical protein